MRLERMAASAQAARRARAMVPAGESVADTVREILADVRTRGDAAVLELEQRFGGGGPLRVGAQERAAALAALDPALVEALKVAAFNVATVAREAVPGDRSVVLPQGQRLRLREIPVRRAAVYAPGGQAPYPSSVVMGVATARAAGVPEIVVCASHPVMVAAAELCRADAVFRMGGAQAIGSLAYGTESIEPVDVIVGPGSLYAQEAKRQVLGHVGIDGFAGPSDLVAIASAGARAELVALDLLAQAEHGAGTIVALASPDAGLLEAVAERVGATAEAGRDGDAAARAAVCVLLHGDLDACLEFAEAFAPEHLQLVGAEAEALAPRVTRAGCLFVGEASGTAFGDYVAGSNHVLPTEGAARFASGLNVRHFLRVMAEVHLEGAAARLAPHGAAIARAEGFEAHARSMEARIQDNGGP